MTTHDEEHLQLLSIFHFVVAIIAGLFSLFPVIHLLVGIGMTAFSFIEPKDTFPIAIVGIIFIVFATLWIAFGLAFTTCVLFTGRFLKMRMHYKYCLVMAGVECIFMPFGTILGVFTIVFLMKENVKNTFNPSVSDPAVEGSHDGV